MEFTSVPVLRNKNRRGQLGDSWHCQRFIITEQEVFKVPYFSTERRPIALFYRILMNPPCVILFYIHVMKLADNLNKVGTVPSTP